MAEFKNKKGASLRLAVFHVLLYDSLAGWETTGAQLAPVLNKIGNGDGTSGAQVTEKMLAQVFGSANNILCLKYSELGIEEGGGKSVTIEKNRGGIIFKESTPQHEIQRWSLLHTYISTVHSTDRERKADRP